MRTWRTGREIGIYRCSLCSHTVDCRGRRGRQPLQVISANTHQTPRQIKTFTHLASANTPTNQNLKLVIHNPPPALRESPLHKGALHLPPKKQNSHKRSGYRHPICAKVFERGLRGKLFSKSFPLTRPNASPAWPRVLIAPVPAPVQWRAGRGRRWA